MEDIASLKAGFLEVVFSKYDMPDVGDALGHIIPTAIYLSVIGTTESLMTLQKIDTMLPDSKPGNGLQEMLAQG